MKNLSLIFCFVLVTMLALTVKGQTKTLSFNQVILVSSIQTVPTGKVWKVDGIAGTRVIQYKYLSQSNADFAPADQQILINSNAISIMNTVGTGSGMGTGNATYGASFSYASCPTMLPLWLPEGTTLAVSTNITYITVIEFIVNP